MGGIEIAQRLHFDEGRWQTPEVTRLPAFELGRLYARKRLPRPAIGPICDADFISCNASGLPLAGRIMRTLLLLASVAATTIASACKVVRSSPIDTSTEAPIDPEVVGAPIPVARVVFRVPSEREITDTVVLKSIRRGRALVRHTKDSLRAYVGNALQCVSCHPSDGTMPNAMPWVGVYARFPQYRSRSGGTILIEDRINDCFLRSMNGRALPVQGRDMRDMVAYMAFLSNGYPVGARVEGESIPPVDSVPGDTTRAKPLYAAKCAVCHGGNGQGTDVAPPLWGPRSFNIGAGMARLWTAAAFIKQVMPQNAPRTLSNQEAVDLAALITKRPRPDFAAKALDWPAGNPPRDVAYRTKAADRKLRAKSPARARTRN
jgi:thiosulfate dehydrogenase